MGQPGPGPGLLAQPACPAYGPCPAHTHSLFPLQTQAEKPLGDLNPGRNEARGFPEASQALLSMGGSFGCITRQLTASCPPETQMRRAWRRKWKWGGRCGQLCSGGSPPSCLGSNNQKRALLGGKGGFTKHVSLSRVGGHVSPGGPGALGVRGVGGSPLVSSRAPVVTRKARAGQGGRVQVPMCLRWEGSQAHLCM